MADNSFCQGGALVLSAGDLAGFSAQNICNIQHLADLIHAFLSSTSVLFVKTGCQEQVFADGHVGVEGVVLKDHGDITLGGGDCVDCLIVDADGALVWFFQTGDAAQECGFATA